MDTCSDVVNLRNYFWLRYVPGCTSCFCWCSVARYHVGVAIGVALRHAHTNLGTAGTMVGMLVVPTALRSLVVQGSRKAKGWYDLV